MLITIASVMTVLVLLVLALLLFGGSGSGGSGGGEGGGQGAGTGPHTGTGEGKADGIGGRDKGVGTTGSKDGKKGARPTRKPGGSNKGKAGPKSRPRLVVEEQPKPPERRRPRVAPSAHGGKPGGGGGGDFFGIHAKGKTIIYIVDCSGSMDGDPFRVAKAELQASIARLKSDQKFFVFFYSSKSYPMPGPMEMRFATEKNRRECDEWVRRMTTKGGTEPLKSLVDALKMRPEAIFFMSDGCFEEEVCSKAREGQIYGTLVPINTIAFLNRRGEDVLKRLAEESAGVYRFVPRDEVMP